MQQSKPALIAVFFLLGLGAVQAQPRPRLVVGITVDQMRYDYLYRYWDDYGETGFKRLLREGHVAHDGHYHYAPTYTGPGHASIFTGAGPVHHGIAGNHWYARKEKKTVYCTEDSTVKPVGTDMPDGQMSPRRLTCTTLADQLELGTNRRSKTIGIALKDRGAILPVGFLSDGAYWYDKTNGRFVTSDFYRKELPTWVADFNKKQLPDQYIQAGWSLLLPDERYDESMPDDRPFEQPFKNTDKAVFPYDLAKITDAKVYGQGEEKYGIVAATPHGTTLTFEFAKAALEAEAMGQDDIPDLLALSFSSPDYTGHQFGPHSVEIQDTYLRLDRELGDFLNYLDASVGLKNTLVFLTADHGAADAPGLVSPPAGYFRGSTFADGLRNYLKHKTGSDPIEHFINDQIYLVKNDSLDRALVEKTILEFTENFPGAVTAISLKDFSKCAADPRICDKLRKGTVPGRSGDYFVLTHPGWISNGYEKGGTTHGSPYAYDTHVPIIFFGWQVVPFDNYDPVWIEDIAPTVSHILKVGMPSACTGKVLGEVVRK